MKLNTLMVRYIVNDVDAAIAFYTRHLGFGVSAQSGPHFAILARENLQLVRSNNLEGDVEALRKAEVKFRNDIVAGPGGRQILLEDPSGNPVELFEPAPDTAK